MPVKSLANSATNEFSSFKLCTKLFEVFVEVEFVLASSLPPPPQAASKNPSGDAEKAIFALALDRTRMFFLCMGCSIITSHFLAIFLEFLEVDLNFITFLGLASEWHQGAFNCTPIYLLLGVSGFIEKWHDQHNSN